jgi:hypothetical protein
MDTRLSLADMRTANELQMGLDLTKSEKNTRRSIDESIAVPHLLALTLRWALRVALN